MPSLFSIMKTGQRSRPNDRRLGRLEPAEHLAGHPQRNRKIGQELPHPGPGRHDRLSGLDDAGAGDDAHAGRPSARARARSRWFAPARRPPSRARSAPGWRVPPPGCPPSGWNTPTKSGRQPEAREIAASRSAASSTSWGKAVRRATIAACRRRARRRAHPVSMMPVICRSDSPDCRARARATADRQRAPAARRRDARNSRAG